MGSEVQLERYMPGYCSTRELGEEASSHAWNYYDRQFHGTSVDLESECDKDGLKQKMLEHDAVFRRQVSELHRLYRTQRDLMDEMKRRELYNNHRPLSLNPMVYQRQDSSKLHSPNLPSSNSACTSPSILGAEHSSPDLSHLKRKALKINLFSVKDVDDSNDCEIIEYRPAKVKRKVFDLQLSADAYIDPDELNQSIDSKPHIPSNCRNGQSLFSGGSSTTSRENGMKDLNEPIQIEDDLPTLDFMNQRSSGKGLYTKPITLQTPPKNFSRESSLISLYGGDCVDSRKALLGDRENNRAQASHQLSLGHFNSKASSISHYLRSENSHKPSLFIHGKNGTSYGTSVPVLPDQIKDKFWKERTIYSPKFAERDHEPRIRSLNRPTEGKCWPPPTTSREKHGCNSSKKQPYFISSVGLSKSSQASNQPSMFFGEKLNVNSGYVVGIPRINELDHGSSSGSKEESICYPSVKFENLGHGKDGARASGCSGNVTSLNYSKGLNGFDLNQCEGMDLSASVANDSPHETPKMEQSKHATLLPWMKPKPFNNDTARAYFSQTSNKFLNKIEEGNMASQCPPRMIIESASRDHGIDLTKSTFDHNSGQMHGFPVSAQPLIVGSFRLSKGHKIETKRNLQVFDMNMPCETETNTEFLSTDEIADKKATGFKNLFDLNSCLTEDEAPVHSASNVAWEIRGIDLEVPAPHEIDEDNTFAMTQQTLQESELEQVAAEAMVLFSSSKNTNIMEREAGDAMETLKWFVGIVSSYPSDSEQQSFEHPLDKDEEPIMRTSTDETDYFEQMTLNMTETTEEEHMPKNAFPTIPNIEEEPVSVILCARPRRGQARRGRPKRDFQRDILPGITSLSRHEVTEDLQAFDGLMRSSGHAWQFGKRAAARNKPRRGRPRTVNVSPVPVPLPDSIPLHIYPSPKQLTNSCIGTGMEERNLTGWGKTTRRPRRQRCPAGNVQPVRLS